MKRLTTMQKSSMLYRAWSGEAITAAQRSPAGILVGYLDGAVAVYTAKGYRAITENSGEFTPFQPGDRLPATKTIGAAIGTAIDIGARTIPAYSGLSTMRDPIADGLANIFAGHKDLIERMLDLGASGEAIRNAIRLAASDAELAACGCLAFDNIYFRDACPGVIRGRLLTRELCVLGSMIIDTGMDRILDGTTLLQACLICAGIDDRDIRRKADRQIARHLESLEREREQERQERKRELEYVSFSEREAAERADVRELEHAHQDAIALDYYDDIDAEKAHLRRCQAEQPFW